ncbi:MAG: hypothetical protein FJ317_06170 [SAR202 cluster bacterium]|nr:hypothetical protein [SAR202 cluster bacterium]
MVAAIALSVGIYTSGLFGNDGPGTVGMVLPGYENTVSDTDIDLAGGIREEGSGEEQDAAGRTFPGYEHISDTPGQVLEDGTVSTGMPVPGYEGEVEEMVVRE